MSLMAELGEGPPPDFIQNGANRRNGSAPAFNMFDRTPMAPRAIMPGPRPDMNPQMMAPPPWPPQAPGMYTNIAFVPAILGQTSV